MLRSGNTQNKTTTINNSLIWRSAELRAGVLGMPKHPDLQLVGVIAG